MQEAVLFAAEIVNILEYIHGTGVIHRDLKPENLMLDANNKLRIIDFGTAEVFSVAGKNDQLFEKCQTIRQRYADESHDVMAFKDSTKPRKSFVGTVCYVAPEMLEHQSVDRGCDFWALGIVTHKMLTGDYLFDDANEYWISQRIRECKYKVADDLADEAKDLIYELLRKESGRDWAMAHPKTEGACADSRTMPSLRGTTLAIVSQCPRPLRWIGGRGSVRWRHRPSISYLTPNHATA